MSTLSFSEIINIHYIINRDIYDISDDSSQQKLKKFFRNYFLHLSGVFVVLFTIQFVKDTVKFVKECKRLT